MIWKFFASVRLTVTLLLALAATSIIGTVIPQNKNPVEYYKAFGDFFYRFFNILDVFDMYHSWWFRSLLLLLMLNILVCSIDRLPGVWKIVFTKNPRFNRLSFKNPSTAEKFTDGRMPDQLKKIFTSVISKRFSYYRLKDADQGFFLFAEKWRWTRMGVYAVHLSIILLLFGGLIGSLFGFDGFITIPEGESVGAVRIQNTGKTIPLGFEIKCEDFNVSFYDSGMPKEFRSRLAILEQGKTILQKDIIVNDPLRYKGINLFQSSYGVMAPKTVTLKFFVKSTGKSYMKTVAIGKPLDLPEEGRRLVIQNYVSADMIKGNKIGETFRGILTSERSEPVSILLPLRFPSFDKMRNGNVVISVADYDKRYYTGLQVTRDPGVWVVYSGFILMIIGCFVTFFMPHQRIFIEVEHTGKESRISVSGTTNKNKLDMQSRIQKLCQNLKRL